MRDPEKEKERRLLRANKEQMICDIEFPLLEIEVANYLEPRGIRYKLERETRKNILEVQIIDEIWMRKPVRLEDLSADLQMIPYLIKRADRIPMDGRGFKTFRNWGWHM